MTVRSFGLAGVVSGLLPLVLAGMLLACSGDTGTTGVSRDGRAADPDRVVAEVNGAPIVESRIEKASEAERVRLAATGTPLTADEERALRRDALALVIAGELVYQAALADGIDVPEDEIDLQLERVRSQFADEEEFEHHLEATGSSAEVLREEARRRLLMEKYVDAVTRGLDVADDDARKIYEEQEDRFMGEEQLRAAQILVRLRPGDPAERREAARRRIEEAHRRAVAGEEFGALAREYSESPLAERGGDMGFFPRGRTLPEFEQVVFSVPVGQISPVFETPHGFHVVKVLEHRKSGLRPFEEVRTELLMVLAREKRDQALQERVASLREQAEIRILDPELKPRD
jgi:peptidyl-prolyl cis-trans isomerase C